MQSYVVRTTLSNEDWFESGAVSDPVRSAGRSATPEELAQGKEALWALVYLVAIVLGTGVAVWAVCCLWSEYSRRKQRLAEASADDIVNFNDDFYSRQNYGSAASKTAPV